MVDELLGKKQAYVVDMACLVELEHVLRSKYLFPRHMIVSHFQMIASHPRLVVDELVLERVLADYTTYPALSFVDCCLAEFARSSGNTPLLTFDKKLARQLPHAELVG